MANVMLTFGLCPYVDCAHKLDLKDTGWFICGACGRMFWAVHESKLPAHARQHRPELRKQFFCYLPENKPKDWPQPPPIVLPILTVESLGKSRWSLETH